MYVVGCTVHTRPWTVISQTYQRHSRNFGIFDGELYKISKNGFRIK